ncbi:MAG: hypothetical protein HUJ72_06350 [Blautia sp.]|nr:hypothetical protein [Blautia sp.]
MLDWMEHFYIDSSIQNPQKVKEKLDKGRPVVGIYLLTRPANDEDMLEMISAVSLVQKGLYSRCPQIIAMAKSRERAIEILRELTEASYKKHGTVNLQGIIECIRENR